MAGGAGGPCVPAHGPNIFLVCHHRRNPRPCEQGPNPANMNQTQCEPAPARPRVVDLSCRLIWGVAFWFTIYMFPPHHHRHGFPKVYRQLTIVNRSRTKKDPAKLGAGQGYIGRGGGKPPQWFANYPFSIARWTTSASCVL